MKTLLLLALLSPWYHADSLLNKALNDSLIPGAVLCVVEADTIQYIRAYGQRALVPERETMTTTTIFDLASVSKPIGAGTAALQLIQAGRLHADDPVRKYLPAFDSEATIRHLMTHTSGLPPYMNARRLDSIYNARNPEHTITRQAFFMDTICRCQRQSAPGEKYTYSCLNFITLQAVVETITGQSLHALRPYYRPLPIASIDTFIAPTEILPDGHILRGEVHDPLARVMMEGVSGNAGVFMSAEQVAEWCCWLMNLPDSVRTQACNAGLWTDKDGSLNHTGYTGTSIRLYPAKHRAIILLTNRVHPHDTDNAPIAALRRELYRLLRVR